MKGRVSAEFRVLMVRQSTCFFNYLTIFAISRVNHVVQLGFRSFL
jgi:hypothetical protein